MKKLFFLSILVCSFVLLANNIGYAALLSDDSRGTPVVLESFPKNDGVDIPVDSRIIALFSRPMRKSDLSEFTCTLNDGVSDIATNVHYNSALKKVVMVPLEDLLAKHVYYVTISHTVRDEEGNGLGQDYSFKFKTVSEIVKIAPVIAKISPTVGSRNVAVDSNIEMTFSTAMDEKTLNEENIFVTSGKERILGIVRYYPSILKAVFIPDRQLKPDTDYTILVKNVQNIRGTAMEFERSWSFHTEEKIEVTTRALLESSAMTMKKDRLRRIREKIAMDGESSPAPQEQMAKKSALPPVLVEQYPADNIDMVRTDAHIKVRFKNAMNPKTLNIFNFSLREGDNFIFGRVEYDEKQNYATLIPSGKLKADTEYKVTLSHKLEDEKGHSIGDDITWKFKTVTAIATFTAKREMSKEATVDLTAPHVISVSPAHRNDQISPDVEIEAHFNEYLKDFTVNSFTFRVNNGENDINGRVGYDNTNRRIWFKPEKPLQTGVKYNVVITRGIMDRTGLYMQKEKKWSFLVGAKWNTAVPRIMAVTPEPGIIPVGKTYFEARYSEKLNASTVNSESVRLLREGQPVHGRVTVLSDGVTVRFEPREMLNLGGHYALEMGKVEGAAGNPVEKSLIYNYTIDTTMEKTPSTATSVAQTHDAQVEMKMIESVKEQPMYSEVLKQENNFQIGPEEMAKRMAKSDKSAAGKVEPRRIKDSMSLEDQINRSHMLNKSLSGMDVAMKDDVRQQLEKFLGESTRKNRALLEKINDVNEKEMQLVKVAPVSGAIITEVRNGKSRSFHEDVIMQKERENLFGNELQYGELQKLGGGSGAAEPVEKDVMIPTSNIVQTSKHRKGSGVINGVTLNELDSTMKPLVERAVMESNPSIQDSFVSSESSDLMVTAIHPTRNQINVKNQEIVTVAFNREVDLSSVHDLSFIVTQGEEIVPGKIVYNPRFNKVIFRPEEKLKEQASYQVTLTNGIKTRDGKALRPLNWTFQTRQM